jgi:hypothetical protein
MNDDLATITGVYGRAPSEWEDLLVEALHQNAHADVRKALCALGREIQEQNSSVESSAGRPRLERLVEQARRLTRSEPTELEALEGELNRERGLWASYRERYREAFVPPALQSYLDSCCVFVQPSADGVQFHGFDKYRGLSPTRGEAVTLFSGPGDGTPPNFLSRYEPRQDRFVVERAYRTTLPRGAGLGCILEHIDALVPEDGGPAELVFDNVKNSATFVAHVQVCDGVPSLRPGVDGADSPLGRLGQRLLARRGRTVVGVRPTLDAFGFLDLTLISAEAPQSA